MSYSTTTTQLMSCRQALQLSTTGTNSRLIISHIRDALSPLWWLYCIHHRSCKGLAIFRTGLPQLFCSPIHPATRNQNVMMTLKSLEWLDLQWFWSLWLKKELCWLLVKPDLGKLHILKSLPAAEQTKQSDSWYIQSSRVNFYGQVYCKFITKTEDLMLFHAKRNNWGKQSSPFQ